MSGRILPDTGHLPRNQNGANPQHVIAALLGDYWLDRTEHLPSVTLVSLVAEFGVTTASARAALSRLLRRGTLEIRKSGRNTYYRLSPLARRTLAAARAALVASTAPQRPDWDGSWVVVAFSVSEDRREVRHALRAGLRRLGFGPLYDGIWAAPLADRDALVELIGTLDVRPATVLRCSVLHPDAGTGHPLHGWNLDPLIADYQAFIGRYSPLVDALRAGRLASDRTSVDRTSADRTPVDRTLADRVLATRATLVDDWRELCERTPALPVELLPETWPGAQAVSVFRGALEGLAPLAEARFAEIVAAVAPSLAPFVTTRRAQDDPAADPAAR